MGRQDEPTSMGTMIQTSFIASDWHELRVKRWLAFPFAVFPIKNQELVRRQANVITCLGKAIRDGLGSTVKRPSLFAYERKEDVQLCELGNFLVVEQAHGSEKVVRAAFTIVPKTGIAFGAFLLAFHLDRASEARSTVGSLALVRPDSHVERIVAALVGACFLKGLQNVNREVDSSSDWRLSSHGVSPEE
jgi:hypothetical protein